MFNVGWYLFGVYTQFVVLFRVFTRRLGPVMLSVGF